MNKLLSISILSLTAVGLAAPAMAQTPAEGDAEQSRMRGKERPRLEKLCEVEDIESFLTEKFSKNEARRQEMIEKASEYDADAVNSFQTAMQALVDANKDTVLAAHTTFQSVACAEDVTDEEIRAAGKELRATMRDIREETRPQMQAEKAALREALEAAGMELPERDGERPFKKQRRGMRGNINQ